MTRSPIVVIGAGVSGLTCGVRLLEEGYDVEIWARERTPNTTSDIAAATWYPLRGERDERTDGWLPVFLSQFTALAAVSVRFSSVIAFMVSIITASSASGIRRMA